MRPIALSGCLNAALLVALAHGQERQPAQALARYRSGVKALEAAQVERAVGELREAVRLDPLLGSAHYELGRALMTRRRYPEAVQALVAARDAFRQADQLAREARARVALRGKVETLDDVDYHELDHNKRFPMQYVYEPTRTRALDIPKDQHAGHAGAVPAAVLAALGSAHHRTGALAEAEQAYLEALEVDPALGEVHNNLAVVYLQTGRTEEAGREVERSEECGFQVNPGLKQEIAAQRGR
jgi:tetratricopeptide (TPR) repeat protein